MSADLPTWPSPPSVGGTNTPSQNVAITTPGGNPILAVAVVPHGSTVTSCISTLSGTFGSPIATGVSIGNVDLYAWKLENATAGSDTITVNVGATTQFWGMAAGAVTGSSGTDGTQYTGWNNQSSTGTTRSSASLTPSSTGLIVGVCYIDDNGNTGAVDTGNGFSALSPSSHFWAFGTGNLFAWVEKKSISSATAATFPSVGSTLNSGTFAIIFADAGGSGSASICWVHA